MPCVTFLSLKLQEFMVLMNYLDDFLFVACMIQLCNWYMTKFIQLCAELNVPLAEDKTVWTSLQVIFLGILMLGDVQMLSIPVDKKVKALNMLNVAIDSKKITVQRLEEMTGLLNFLCKAIHPGRAFTRRLYAN